MNKWNDLTMKEKAALIKVGVANGFRNIDDIRDQYNSFYSDQQNYNFEDGGRTRKQSINRANYVATNYNDANDFDMNPILYAANKASKNLINKGLLSNCTLSATQWIDPSNQYMSARNIVGHPDSGYTEISPEYALPGDLIISRNPDKNKYHTMLIEGFDENNQPLVRYSRGGHNTEKNLVKGITLDSYHTADINQGGYHTEDHYFRPNVYNEHWLPELIVTPNNASMGNYSKASGGYLDILPKPLSYRTPNTSVPTVRYENGGNLSDDTMESSQQMAFLQDWSNRYNNEGNTTFDQVLDAYNNTPIVQIEPKPGIGGTYRDGTIEMPYSTDFNKNLSHEESHMLRDKIGGGTTATTEENKKLLEEAYPNFYVPLEEIQKSALVAERLATNTEYRTALSKRAGGIWGEDLNNYIDNMSDTDLLSGIGVNGYVLGADSPFTGKGYINGVSAKSLLSEYRDLINPPIEENINMSLDEYYGMTEEERTNRIKELEDIFNNELTEEHRKQAEALRKALKTIAQNSSNSFKISDNAFLAANGGKLNFKRNSLF